MPTLFIHGISNRDEVEFNTHVADVVRPRLNAALRRAGLTPEADNAVRGVFWGTLGSSLAWGGHSIPGANRLSDAQPTARPADVRQAQAMLDVGEPGWRFSATSPTSAPAGASAAHKLAVAPAALSPRGQILASLDRALATEKSRVLLARLSLPPADLGSAVVQYLDTPSIAGALTAGQDVQVRAALPDAVIARLRNQRSIASPTGLDPLAYDAEGRAALAAVLADVADAGESAEDWLSHPGLMLATVALRQVRMDIMRLVTPNIGDVMVYLAAGDGIRNILAHHVAAIRADFPGQPMRLIGHSLGSVVGFDYLNTLAAAGVVDLFVSVGSQISLFAEYGCLYHQARPGEHPPAPLPRPAGVTRWLNIYNPDDFLSFTLQGVFAVDGASISEVAVDTDTPFTASHSAYFTADKVYDAIAQAYAT